MDASPAAAALTKAYGHYQRGALDLAEAGYREAVRLDPHDASARNALGVVVAALGRIPEAYEQFRAAVELDPAAVGAGINLADAALNLGRLDEAFAALEPLASSAPSNADVQALLAEVLALSNRPREALVAASRWTALAPGQGEAHRAHGVLSNRVGERGAALASLRRARQLEPGADIDVQGIAEALEPARFEGADRRVHDELVECLGADGVESQTLARAAGDLLAVTYELRGTPRANLDEWQASGWPADPLLIALLERTINVDPRLERVLVAQRRALLDAFVAGGALPDAWRRFAAAMAIQCFANEYAWRIDASEAARAGTIASSLDAAAGDVDRLVMVASYRALDALPQAPALAAAEWPESAARLVRRALVEPLEERSLALEIPRAAIVDETSAAVRAQYEASPYPRWVDLPTPNPEPLVRQLAGHFPALRATPALAPPHRILIAGCGSGRHPLRVARGAPGASVVAIDLSLASLAFAARRARELGVDNVVLRQLDILDVGALEGDFAVIESSGVLHHMRDPAAGLAALVAKLRAGGVIKLGLYSRRARRLVTAARERIAAAGLDASPAAIRGFRADILDGAIGGLEALAESSDLYSLSTCRDLLFHVQEHQYSPLELRELIEGAGLEFLGFQMPGHAALERYQARFPGDGIRNDLERWDALEADHPGTFANTFQLWCQKPG